VHECHDCGGGGWKDGRIVLFYCCDGLHEGRWSYVAGWDGLLVRGRRGEDWEW
jgi:hypothetical protein